MDTQFVRKNFPGLNRDFIFLDNAGGSQTCIQSIEKITEYLSNYNVQLGASYSVSDKAKKLLIDAHHQLKDWINAERKEEVIIGSSATMLLRILSICLGKTWNPGDEIIISNTEHEANGSCWTDLEEIGIKVKYWEFDPDTFTLDLQTLESMITDKTKLVTVCHCSNIFGTINDIEAIADIVHKKGSLLCVDGVAFAPHRRVDVQKFRADFYVFSCYKVFGPHMALMYGRYDLLEKLPGINHYFIDEIPYKFQPGNFNFELTYGLTGVCDYLKSLNEYHSKDSTNNIQEVYDAAYDFIALQEESLSKIFVNYLQENPDIKIIGSKEYDRNKRVPTVAFTHKEMSSDEVVRRMDSYKIGIRYGDFYSKKIIETLGLESKQGVIRVSFVHYNTLEEVEILIKAFNEIFSLATINEIK